MPENLISLFQYLEKEDINIDKTEFEYQIQSHPDYPSLLSIADTLSFFNIDNGALRVDISEIDLLPYRFIALLSERNNNPQLTFIDNKNGKYYCTNDKKTIKKTRLELEKLWKDTVLLVEKPEYEATPTKKNDRSNFLPVLCLGLLSFTLLQLDSTLQSKLFLLFPVIGFLFSIAALKDLFGAKSELINNFCNITSSTSCNTIVNSGKWKIFEIVSFSDLSITFFTTQFIGLILFLFIVNGTEFFSLQQILLFCSVPVLVVSIYFQKFVERKWCPICLAIIAVVLLELVYLILFIKPDFNFSLNSIMHLGFLFSSILMIWFGLKKLLIKQKELKEFQIKANRFIRNYTNFKNTLLTKEKTELPFTPIIFGNPESKTHITMITNPFCGHCEATHEILDKILEKKGQDLQIKIIIKTDLSNESDENKLFFQNLMGVYLENGALAFGEVLKNWFENKNVKNWLKIHQIENINIPKIEAVYNTHSDWCVTNNFSFTPTIFVNGYQFPDSFERDNLPNFINDLIEDEDF